MIFEAYAFAEKNIYFKQLLKLYLLDLTSYQCNVSDLKVIEAISSSVSDIYVLNKQR